MLVFVSLLGIHNCTAAFPSCIVQTLLYCPSLTPLWQLRLHASGFQFCPTYLWTIVACECAGVYSIILCCSRMQERHSWYTPVSRRRSKCCKLHSTCNSSSNEVFERKMALCDYTSVSTPCVSGHHNLAPACSAHLVSLLPLSDIFKHVLSAGMTACCQPCCNAALRVCHTLLKWRTVKYYMLCRATHLSWLPVGAAA